MGHLDFQFLFLVLAVRCFVDWPYFLLLGEQIIEEGFNVELICATFAQQTSSFSCSLSHLLLPFPLLSRSLVQFFLFRSDDVGYLKSTLLLGKRLVVKQPGALFQVFNFSLLLETEIQKIRCTFGWIFHRLLGDNSPKFLKLAFMKTRIIRITLRFFAIRRIPLQQRKQQRANLPDITSQFLLNNKMPGISIVINPNPPGIPLEKHIIRIETADETFAFHEAYKLDQAMREIADEGLGERAHLDDEIVEIYVIGLLGGRFEDCGDYGLSGLSRWVLFGFLA